MSNNTPGSLSECLCVCDTPYSVTITVVDVDGRITGNNNNKGNFVKIIFRDVEFL